MHCVECRHWKRYGGEYIVRHLEEPRPWGLCRRLGDDESGLTGDEELHPQTIDTFGCIRFEPQEKT